MEPILERIISLCKEKKLNNETSIYDNVSSIIRKEYGVYNSPESIRGIVRRYRKSNNLDENFNKIDGNVISKNISLVFNSDGSKTSDMLIHANDISNITPEQLLKKHNFDPNKFELLRANNSKWTNGSDETLYSSKITVKPKECETWSEDLICKIFDKVKIKPCETKYEKTNYEKNGNALVLPIADLHYGLRSDLSVTGNIYNKDVASYYYNTIVDDVLSRIKGKKIEKIYFTIGSDMLNCDNKAGTTTKGTPQNNDGCTEDFIVEVTDMLIGTVEQLRKISNVEIVYVNANHDSITSFGIANSLRILYRNCKDVTVDSSPIERKYKVFGNTLIGFAHKLNSKNINDIVQMDAREFMSQTTNTVYLLQHFHHEIAIDSYGTDIRTLPTISALSRWGYENAYGARQKCQSFIVNGKYGITDVLYSFV